MRPLILKMTAFGPYKDTEIVNFTELEDNRLFVISGATGAGKTTIFDGISFALYGQASGEDRANIRALRSHFADDATQTSVELTFEIKNHIYRIYREVPYTKRNNKNETPAKCQLFELKDGDETPVVDRQMVTEINKKIEEIIGFTQAQFSQIVMLPQGEFRKFLISDTENKEVIMRKIFKTDQYQKLVTKLKEQRDDIHAKLQGEEQQKRAVLEHIKTVIPLRESKLRNVLQQDTYLVEQVVEALIEEQQYYDDQVEEAKKQYEEKFQQHERLLTTYHEAKSIHEQFDTLQQKNEFYQQLHAQISHYKEQHERVELGERASEVVPIEERYLELQKEASVEQRAYTESVETLKAEKLKFEQVKQDYEEIEKQQSTYENQKTERYHLQQLKPKIEQLQAHQHQYQTLQQSSEATKERLQEINNRFTKHIEQIEQVEKQVEQGEYAIESLDEQREQLTVLNTICEKLQQYVEGTSQLKEMIQTKETHQQLHEEAKEKYAHIKQQWLVTEAVSLAAELHEGEACPVCGSVEHPNKAHENIEGVSEEALQKAEQHVHQCSEQYQFSAAQVATLKRQLAEQYEELQQFNIVTNHMSEVKQEKQIERDALQSEVQQLMEQRKQVENLRQQLRQLKQVEASVRAEKEQLTHENVQLEEREKYLSTSIQQLTEEIPSSLLNLQVYTDTLKTVEKEIEMYEEKWKQLQVRFDEHRQAYLTAENHETFKKDLLQTITKRLNEGEKKFQEAVQEAEFASTEAYESAKLDRHTIQTLKREIEQFKEQYNLVREEIRDLQTKLANKERLDLDQLAKELQSLKEAYEQALQFVNEQQHVKRTIEQSVQQLEQIVGRTGKLEKKFGQVEELYNLIRGQNEAKLSFERYIQIEYLEQMLQSANERLHQLSNGQFELLRSDRQEERGRQSGLGLDVYDAYTGQTRDVKTLSGGEKFNAALCLALGMSDIIQSFQGAVSIETMFIDEGFGTLDEESLVKAIDTLIELQKTGRMIGVISHVEELKAAFPAILEVSKTKEGYSQTSFIIK